MNQPVRFDADPRLSGNALTDVVTPQLVISGPRLDRNIAAMSDYCRKAGVELAPHIKTTMSPEIARRQIDAGVWGLTIANPAQAHAVSDLGAPRLVIANEVLDPVGLRTVAELAATTPVFLWVDSLEGVARLDAELDRHGGSNVEVLVELGVDGGRAGCRDSATALDVASAAAAARHVVLAGVSSFEGVIGTGGRTEASLAGVDELLDRMTELAATVVDAGLVDAERIVLTAGGSTYFDRVAERLRSPIGGHVPTVVLRSGCYVTHDHGVYADVSVPSGPHLEAAMELLVTVLSVPEPGVAIVNCGKRNAGFDAGLPVPLWLGAPGGALPDGARVTRMNDQHGWLEYSPAASAPNVGDLVGLGISHPCTTFDKWRMIALVADDYAITDVVSTRF